MQYSKEQVLKGLKIVSNSKCNMDSWHGTCLKLVEIGFTLPELKEQVEKYDTLQVSISEKSRLGDYGGALNMLYNYMSSYLGAQYVRDQFFDLLNNYLVTLDV